MACNSEELLAEAVSTELIQSRRSRTSPSNVHDNFDFSQIATRYFGCIILTRLPSVSKNET